MSLNVNRPHYYDGRFPYFQLPREIGFFSLGSDRNYCDDSHQLKYVVMPPNPRDVCLDLNAGYEIATRKGHSRNEKIDNLLQWILQHQEDIRKHFINPSNGLLDIDFVCYRGMLTGICATIYEKNEDWIICATKFKSVIYLCGFDTQQRQSHLENQSDMEKLMTFWGYKFEQYMTADDAHSKPNTSVPVNEKEEFNSVMKGKLKDYKILFSAEEDGIDPLSLDHSLQQSTPVSRYAELKTNKLIFNERMHNSFCRYKVLKWWLQSFLAGTSRVICGFRDDKGFVRKIESFRVQDLPKMSQGIWSPSACLNFCVDFLDFVKRNVKKDDPNVVYKFYWKPGFDIICEELNSPGEYKILPDWFTKSVIL